MNNEQSAPSEEFKPRELEILVLMAEGYSNQEIADQLFITKGTVRWYNKIIYSKLGTSRRTEAIALARQMGLIGDTSTTPPTTATNTYALPPTHGPFIGRDTGLAELTGLLANPDIHLISIIGAGGMGKSRLALELGYLVQADYQDGVIFIDLTALRNPHDIAQFTLTSLGLSASGSQSPQELLFNFLRAKNILLIFDNFEHVLVGARFLTDLLDEARHIKILTTTRERLNLRVETSFYLQPVIESGADLFCEVARMMQPTIEFNDADQQDIERIVEVVGGLPLGLILAATWVDMLSIHEIAEEIQANLEFLSAELQDMPERQRSMHAVIDPMWHKLSEAEQHAFRWASVFRNGFSREMFEELTGASLRILQTLLHRSLISHGNARRYTIHPLLRQYAREKLEELGQLNSAKHTHLNIFANYAEKWAGLMYEGHYIEALHGLDMEQDNFRAALDWSCAGHQIEEGIRLILALCDFWLIRSQAREGIYYLEQALQHQEKAGLYYWLGMYTERTGNREEAKTYQRKCIELAEEEAHYDFLALSYREMGSVFSILTAEQATNYRNYLFKALAIGQKFGSAKVIADCHIVVGNFLDYVDNQPTAAQEHYQQALNIYENLGDLRGISMATYNIALQKRDDGEIQLAHEYCEYSLNIKRQIGDRAGIARRLSVLANWDIMGEEYDRARRYLVESRTICEELGEQTRLVHTLNLEGLLTYILADFEQAQAIFERALDIAQTVGDLAMLWLSKSCLAMIFLQQNKIDQARSHVFEIIQMRSPQNNVNWLSLIVYINYLWKTGETDDCVSNIAVLEKHREAYGDAKDLYYRYFLAPLIDQVQQYFGTEAWHVALQHTPDITIDQLQAELIASLLE